MTGKKPVALVSYAVRLPLAWEERLEAISTAMAGNPPPDLLRVTVSAVVRQAYRLGMARLTAEYGEGGDDGR